MAVNIVKLLDNPVNITINGGINPLGEYNALTAYNIGDSVSYLGSSYIASQDTTGNLPTDTAYWQILAEKGADGAAGSAGSAGVGVPSGGSTGQVLNKASATDYDTAWTTLGDVASENILPIAKGGTGQSNATAAINNLLPDQTSNSGKFLTTDGSNVSWNTTLSSVAWGDITGTLASQTDLQDELNLKENTISGSNSRILYKDSSGVDKSFEALEVNSYNGLTYSVADVYGDAESHSINFNYIQLNPTEDAPATTINITSTDVDIDSADSGFNSGSSGNALNINAVNIRAEGTGDVGAISFINNNFVAGNGTDAISLRGASYAFGFGEIKNGVSVVGPLQGYGFQPIIRSGASMDTASYATAFYDNTNYEVSSSYHTSFNSGPTIPTIPSTKGYTGMNISPDITTIETNSGVMGVIITGNYGTFEGTSYFQGVTVNPTIAEARYTAGIQVSMDNVTPYAGIKASVTIQDLTFEFNQAGSYNNTFTMQFTSGATAGSEVVSIAGSVIEVQIESGVSTATQIKTACDSVPTFFTNVSTTISGTGSNAQVTSSATNFAGGEDPGRVLAAYLDGDVDITGGLTFNGALSIGKLNAFQSEAMIDGGGTPSSIHSLITNPTVAANATLTSADTIAVNTAALINIGDNASVSTAFIGVAALGLPAVLTMGTGSTLDRVYGALFALSLDAAATGGTVDEVGLCKALAIPNGATTVNKLYGYLFDLPFGDPGSTTWGFYDRPGKNNYFAGNLLIGGTAGSDDTVTNSSTALEIKSTTKAFLNARMSTTERDALTAVNGMQIYNTTTDKLQVYAAGSWVDLH